MPGTQWSLATNTLFTEVPDNVLSNCEALYSLLSLYLLYPKTFKYHDEYLLEKSYKAFITLETLNDTAHDQ